MTPARGRLDPLGVLLTAAGAAALAFLPFVLFKANRILPGDPRGCCRPCPPGRSWDCRHCCCW